MPLDFHLDEMNLRDKLELLETLWNHLRRQPEQAPSPDWHKELLDERQRRLETGTERILDWELAKQEIRQRTS